MFSGLFRSLKPLVSMGLNVGKKILTSDAAKQIGSAAVDIGKSTLKNVAADLIEGKNATESLNQGLEEAKSTISSKIRGAGKKRRRQKKCKTISCKSKKCKYNLLE